MSDRDDTRDTRGNTRESGSMFDLRAERADTHTRGATRAGEESAGQMAPGIKTALENFASFIKTLDDRPSPDDESDDEDDTPAKRRRTELVQKIGSILDENTGAMKENDYRVAMDALKELM